MPDRPEYGTFDMDVVADGEPCDCGALELSTCRCPTLSARPESEAAQ
jgi:hypothetical protein